MLCIVQAEAHWRLELQDVPPRAISAQENVVLLQPVRTRHFTAFILGPVTVPEDKSGMN